MGMNLYAHIKATYKKYDYEDPVSVMYDGLDDDPKVEELTNGYVWRHTYYKTLEDLNKNYYHVLHIGKSSAGWHFALCVYPVIGIKNLDDWKKLWESKDCKLFTEDDEEITPKEALKYIINRKPWSNATEAEMLESHNKMAKEHGIGNVYRTYDDYMIANHARRGYNGLWAHNDGRHKGTDGTYDLTEDANFW